MTKFPVIRDLEVDRSCTQEHQKQALMYLGEGAVPDEKEKFYGAVLAQEAYLLHSSTENCRHNILLV